MLCLLKAVSKFFNSHVIKCISNIFYDLGLKNFAISSSILKCAFLYYYMKQNQVTGTNKNKSIKNWKKKDNLSSSVKSHTIIRFKLNFNLVFITLAHL